MDKTDGLLLQCYNRGCGKKFSPEANTDGSCRHHPGTPVFHDAYKGWSCCNKKSTDFTEFLNIKGCTLSKHSDTKPPEPTVQKPSVRDEEIAISAGKRITKGRPPLESPLKIIEPAISPYLKEQLQSLKVMKTDNSDDITTGTVCKHAGCNTAYEGLQSNNTTCIYHPGIPIFHEGLKYWSCCQKRTTDFNTFLSQVGCERGKHMWKDLNDDDKVVKCRWDYHQTSTHIIVSVYAKKYCPDYSVLKLNPIRLYIKLVFPEKNNASFEMDSELFGVVDVDASEFAMYGTKIEIKLKKAEPSHWLKLEMKNLLNQPESGDKCLKKQEMNNIAHSLNDVDLSDL